MDLTKCVDCGTDLPSASVGRSDRCLKCLGPHLSRRALDEFAEMDADILDRVDLRKQKAKDIAAELNLTKAAIYARIKTARAREEERAQGGSSVFISPDQEGGAGS